jgi:hypothetical protein
MEPPWRGVAVKVTFVPGQIAVPGLAVMETLTGKLGSIRMGIAFEAAGFPVAQRALEVISQVTTSPLTKDVLENTLLLVPTFTALIFHW